MNWKTTSIWESEHAMPVGRTRDGRKSDQGFSLLEMMVVLVIAIVIAAMAMPKVMSIVRNTRTAGDAQSLNSAILLAKMRAASDFARARVYMDLTANTYRVDVYPSGGSAWTTEGGTQSLATGNSFGYGSLTAAPSGVASLTQSPACLQGMVAANTIANTACIMFNSRGIPVDSTWSATPNDAVYVTDGKTVVGVTVGATGLTKIWRSPASTAVWIQK